MSEEITNQEKIELGSRSKEIVQCGQCGKDLTVEERNAFEGENGNDIYFCDDCINQIRERFDKITKNLNMPKAFLFSFVTAIVCGLLYGLSIYLTNTDFGIITIGVAYLIALTACKGAGDKRGIKLQVLSIILTLVAIFVAQDLYMILKSTSNAKYRWCTVYPISRTCYGNNESRTNRTFNMGNRFVYSIYLP